MADGIAGTASSIAGASSAVMATSVTPLSTPTETITESTMTGQRAVHTNSLFPSTTAVASTNGIMSPDVLAAQRNFVCPTGYTMFRVPPATEARSLMYNYGVRVEEIDPHAPSPQIGGLPGLATSVLTWGKRKRIRGRFYCMADSRCRERKTFVRISNKCTTSASDHLRVIHGIASERSVLRNQQPKRERKRERPFEAEQLRCSERFTADRDRYLVLDYIKSHTILGLEPLDYLENSHRRLHMLLLGGKKQPYPVDALDARGVKEGLLEIYAARNAPIKEALENEKRSTPIRFVHVSVNELTAGSAPRDRGYIGLRVSFLTQEFRHRSHLLAVRQFDPGKSVGGERGADLVTAWAGQVLGEFGLDWPSVCGAVAHPQVPFCREKTEVLVEPCIPAMLDEVMVAALGLGQEAGRGGQAGEALDAIRRAVESMDDAALAKVGLNGAKENALGTLPSRPGQLRQAACTRWESGVAAVERVLVSYPSVASFFERGLSGGENGAVSEAAIEEIYSLIKSLTLVMLACHSSTEPAAPTALLRLIMLLSSELDGTKPLDLHEACHSLDVALAVTARRETKPPQDAALPASVTGTAGGAPSVASAKKATRNMRLPAELTEIGRKTRSLIRKGVYEAFGGRRWGKKHGESSHLYDMVLALHPGCRQLGYIDRLSPEKPEMVSLIKSKVYAQLMRMTEAVVTSERAAAAKALPTGASALSAANSGDGAAPKRARLAESCSPFDDDVGGGSNDEAGGHNGAADDPMMTAGVFDAEQGALVVNQEKTAAEEAATAVEEWCAAKLPSHHRTIRTGEGLLHFWRTYGSQNFRLISIVARSVLGAPGSSAVLDRDLDDADGLANNRQLGGGAAPDEGFREMAMLLCASFASIPENVPPLRHEALHAAVPRRFRDPKMRKEVAEMVHNAGGSAKGGGLSIFEIDRSAEGVNGTNGTDDGGAGS